MIIVKKFFSSVNVSFYINIGLAILIFCSIYFNFYINNYVLLIQDEISRVEQKIREEEKSIKQAQTEFQQFLSPNRLVEESKKSLNLVSPKLSQIKKDPLKSKY